MKLYFLGTAGSKPTLERNPPCIALAFRKDVILFDCGEGSQRQMIKRIKQSKIKRIFITHFHGDHYLGLPGLIMTMSLNDRKDPLEIYGPEGTIEFLSNLFRSGYMEIGYELMIRELKEDTLEFEGYSIKSFPVDHGVPSLGFIFMEDDRRGAFNTEKAKEIGLEGKMFSLLEEEGELEVSGRIIKLGDVTGKGRHGVRITYSGDTRPVKFPSEAKGSDVLIHEATFLEDSERKETYHSTVKEACEAADAIGAVRLILTHINSRYAQSEIEAEAKRHFGNVAIAEDLMEVEI